MLARASPHEHKQFISGLHIFLLSVFTPRKQLDGPEKQFMWIFIKKSFP